MAKNEKKKDSLKLTQEDIFAMRAEFFDKVKDADLRARILTIAFAYGEDTGEPHATDMMAWYLAQEENRDQIDELAAEYAGFTPDDAMEDNGREDEGREDSGSRGR